MQNSPPPFISRFTALVIGVSLFTINTGMVATAQTTSQTYRLTVPESAAVTTPVPQELSQTADGSSNSFAPQVWSLASTSSRGLVATFSIDQPFQHETVADANMNASLNLQLMNTTGNSLWTLPQASATTSQGTGSPAASVRVESNGSGRADLELEVGYDNSGNLPAGKYSTTLVFTIAIP